METFQFKVSRSDWQGWTAEDINNPPEGDWTGDHWRQIGNQGRGSTIQDALEDLIEQVCESNEVDEIKYNWK